MPDQTPDNKNETTRPWLKTLTGARIRIRTPGRETKNQTTVIEFVEPPHSAPPVFTRHEFIEVFCIIDGVLTFQFIDEPCFTLTAGQSITCAGWRPHSFWNETDQSVTALLVCSPAGLDEFFEKSDQLLRQSKKHSADALHESMKALRDQYGLEHIGKPPVLASHR